MTEIGQHKRVWEYDGSFKCLDCKSRWGALPGHPTMPVDCTPAPEREQQEQQQEGNMDNATSGSRPDAEATSGLELTKLCARTMGLIPFRDFGQFVVCTNEKRRTVYFGPLVDDAQAMALVKRMSLQVHHHGCADAKASLVTVTGKWMPFTQEYRACTDNLNRAIVECVAKMELAKIRERLKQKRKPNERTQVWQRS